jgi:hypothetical protein
MCPVKFGKIAVTRGAVQLSPGATTGMTIGPQVVQPSPAAIVTLGVGTKVPRGVHGTGTSVRWGHGSGRHRRRWFAMRGISFTQGTMGLFRQALKRLGLVGAVALGLSWHGWGGQTWLGPRDVQQDEEPHEHA